MVEQLLTSCEALTEKREQIEKYWFQQAEDNIHLQELLSRMLASPVHLLVQFLLDPSVLPDVLSGCQQGHYSLEDVFILTRTHCYAMHRRRLQLAGKLM